MDVVAGLARELDALRRLVEPLAGSPDRPGRVDELSRLVAQLADTVATLTARHRTPVPTWLLLPADPAAAARVLDELAGGDLPDAAAVGHRLVHGGARHAEPALLDGALVGLAIGASGAVFGLMGAAFLMQRARGIDPMQSGIGAVILLNLVLGFVIANVSIGAHIGGLIGGALAGWAMDQVSARRRGLALPLVVCAAVGAIAVAGAFAVSNAKADSLGLALSALMG
jgi:hypothetical protein